MEELSKDKSSYWEMKEKETQIKDPMIDMIP